MEHCGYQFHVPDKCTEHSTAQTGIFCHRSTEEREPVLSFQSCPFPPPFLFCFVFVIPVAVLHIVHLSFYVSCKTVKLTLVLLSLLFSCLPNYLLLVSGLCVLGSLSLFHHYVHASFQFSCLKTQALPPTLLELLIFLPRSILLSTSDYHWLLLYTFSDYWYCLSVELPGFMPCVKKYSPYRSVLERDNESTRAVAAPDSSTFWPS